MTDTFFKLLSEQGLLVAALVISVVALARWFTTRIYPDIKEYIAALNKRADDYRLSMLQEMKEIKEEARTDKKLMYDAFMRNIESNIKLSESLNDVSAQLSAVKNDVSTLKNDVHTVYVLIGKDRQLLDKKQGE